MSEGSGTDGTTIFQDQSGAITAAPTTPPTDTLNLSIPEEVKTFVGEGKKYASVIDALKSVPHAQKYIDEQKTILSEKEQEVERLKEELAKRKTMEEYLEQIKEHKSNDRQAPAAPVDMEVLIERKLTQISENKRVQENLLTVDATMKKQYGEKAKEVFANKANELGVSIDYLTKLAATSPAAFYKLVDVKADTGKGMHTTTALNTEAMSNTNTDQRSARINKVGATSSDMVTAWRNALPKGN